MLEIAKNIIELLEYYFVYIYPGYVSFAIYQFSRAKSIRFDRSIFGISIIISYIYILLYGFVFGKASYQFSNLDYISLLLIATVMPVIFHKVSRCKCVKCILANSGFNVTIEDDVWDYIQYKDEQGVNLKVFLDSKDTMYEGALRYREFTDEKKVICLSGYRRYIKENSSKYQCIQNYGGDDTRWVLIDCSDVTRFEIQYQSPQ